MYNDRNLENKGKEDQSVQQITETVEWCGGLMAKVYAADRRGRRRLGALLA